MYKRVHSLDSLGNEGEKLRTALMVVSPISRAMLPIKPPNAKTEFQMNMLTSFLKG